MRIVKIFFLSLPLGLIFFALYFLPRLIKINEVTCRSQFGPCNQIVTDVVKRAEGKRLKWAKAQLDSVLSESTLASNYSFQFKLPDKLEVAVIEKKPRFSLRSTKVDVVALIDKNGLVIGLGEVKSLPYLQTETQLPNVGETVSSKTLFALEIVYDLYSSYGVGSGRLEDESLSIEFEDGPIVIFPLEGEKDVLVGSLAAILTRLNSEDQEDRIEGEAPVIDLRFKNPVIK